MPGKDGTGPAGPGANKGRGNGMGGNRARNGAGLAIGFGLARCAASGMGRRRCGESTRNNSEMTRKEWLEQRKDILENHLKAVTQELSRL